MLDILRKIVQEVDSASSLLTALDVIVENVQEALSTEVCSIYLLDERSNRYVLMATRGLNPDAVGVVSLGLSEGLVGLVGQREELINLEEASAHPKYRYLPETGEERYNSFLGVPIMHRRKVLGVLVVQQQEKRRFGESEEAFLVTLSAQISGVVAHARALGQLDNLHSPKNVNSPRIFQGVAGASGIAMGRAVVIYPPADIDSVPDRGVEDIDSELNQLNQALNAVRAEMQMLGNKMTESLMPEERALFDVYLRMLDDNALGGEIVEKIHAGNWAQGALRAVIDEHMQSFAAMDDPYLRERMADVRDLGRRILAHLQKQTGNTNRDFAEHSILIGEEISTATLVEIPIESIAAIVTTTGAANSHMAIVARALGIPTVVGVAELPVTSLDDAEMIVDAYQSRVYVHPSRELRKRYKEIIKEERQLVAGLDAYRDLPAETPDGHKVVLYVNTGLMADVARARDRGAEGVGLYRSEIPFMLRDRFPSEEEQRTIYRQQLAAFEPRPVTMRTLDIGGDKDLPYFPINEVNPALGWRGIRITLDHPEIFLVQMRAMLKASIGLNNLQIMLPMVSSVFEIEEAQHLVHRALTEVQEEEKVDIPMPKLGIMIEVPAALLQIRDLASLVDFVSVGSNDLTQYLLAVDRNNSRVADLYTPYHPAVLRSLQYIVNECHAIGKPVGICGEMAGDPGTAILLMAMGFDSLSMSASNLLKIRKVVRTVPLATGKRLLTQALGVDNAAVIRSMMELELNNLGLWDIVRPTQRPVGSKLPS
ncbi:MAG TPA: phosphoenolpyruvate--protein phosphotransferase [Fluviicoccus sp.]|jgi:phosphotransferase system enzyme I (PtsP)|nr:phosphoenolpyruvate--protein phosphotransferase [Fluviicoccus sp.]